MYEFRMSLSFILSYRTLRMVLFSVFSKFGQKRNRGWPESRFWNVLVKLWSYSSWDFDLELIGVENLYKIVGLAKIGVWPENWSSSAVFCKFQNLAASSSTSGHVLHVSHRWILQTPVSSGRKCSWGFYFYFIFFILEISFKWVLKF